MPKATKKKKVITGIVSSVTIVSGATAGIVYASLSEVKNEEIKVKRQVTTKKSLSKLQKSSVNLINSKSQPTIYIDDKDGQHITTNETDLSDMNITKIIQIGFFENKTKQIQAVKMPKTIQKVPHDLPKLITSTKQMFEDTISFNQDISSWNVQKIKNMSGMFAGAKAFNQNIEKWDVSNVTNMNYMFDGALAFDQNLSAWNVKNVTTADEFASKTIISNRINKLPQWKDKNIKN